jgi:hypothetical protein
MRLINILIFISVGLIAFIGHAFASNPATGHYNYNIQLPQSMHWRLAGNQQDATGYTKTYLPSSSTSGYPQNLQMGFTLGDKTPLQNAMQIVLNQHKVIPCRQNSSQMITSKKDVIIYTTSMTGCPNGKDLWQVIKSFNMPDGNYSMIYAADPKVVPEDTLQKMKTAIVSAQLQ